MRCAYIFLRDSALKRHAVLGCATRVIDRRNGRRHADYRTAQETQSPVGNSSSVTRTDNSELIDKLHRHRALDHGSSLKSEKQLRTNRTLGENHSQLGGGRPSRLSRTRRALSSFWGLILCPGSAPSLISRASSRTSTASRYSSFGFNTSANSYLVILIKDVFGPTRGRSNFCQVSY